MELEIRKVIPTFMRRIQVLTTGQCNEPLPKWFWWAVVAGFLLRLAFCLSIAPTRAASEMDGPEYLAYARSLLAGTGDAYPRLYNLIRPPLYPIFLVPFTTFGTSGIRLLQLVQSGLGVLCACVLAQIAREWAGRLAGNWALIFSLFHPFFIFFAAFVMAEILFTTLLWLGILALLRFSEASATEATRWLNWSAVALALAVLCRPALQVFLPITTGWIGWVTWRSAGPRSAFAHTGRFVLLVSVLLLPWQLGNLWSHGEFSLAPGYGQVIYSQSNSPELLDLYHAQTKTDYYQTLDSLLQRYFVPSTNSPTPLRAGTSPRPLRGQEWWHLQWHKSVHFWTPWLNPLIFPRPLVVLSFLVSTPLFVLAAVELRRRRHRVDPFFTLLLGLIAVGFLVGGWLFLTSVRYRIPFVDAAFLLLSASWLGNLHSRVSGADRGCPSRTFLEQTRYQARCQARKE